MRQAEFNELCRDFRLGPPDDAGVGHMYHRIFVASLQVLRQRLVVGGELGDKQMWRPKGNITEMIAKFLDSCDRLQLRLLKNMAEAIAVDVDTVPESEGPDQIH